MSADKLAIEGGSHLKHLVQKVGKRIFLSPPHMGGEELRFIREAFQSNYIAPLGPMVDAFEREFSENVGISNALAVTSGTAAMHLALHSLSVGDGDEVFVSDLTFTVNLPVKGSHLTPSDIS